MNSIMVSTVKGLKEAKEKKYDKIIVTGDLANKVKKSRKITKLGKGATALLIAALGVTVVSAPISGGVSLVAAAPAAAMTGVEVAAIIAASSVGITLILALYKGYEEIEYEEGKITLRKKGK